MDLFKKQNPKKETVIAIHLPMELKEQLIEFSKTQGLPLSSYIRHQLVLILKNQMREENSKL